MLSQIPILFTLALDREGWGVRSFSCSMERVCYLKIQMGEEKKNKLIRVMGKQS